HARCHRDCSHPANQPPILQAGRPPRQHRAVRGSPPVVSLVAPRDAGSIPESPLDLLAIGAHPDDVEISCGGTMALASAQGLKAGILDLSAGEMGTNGTPEIRA